MGAFCVNTIAEAALVKLYDEMMAGANRQPCVDCGKLVKAEYCFCHVCGKVFCDIHADAHRTSSVPVGKLPTVWDRVGG